MTLKDKILMAENASELIETLISDTSTAYKKTVLEGSGISLTRAQISTLANQFKAQNQAQETGFELDGELSQSDSGEPLEAVPIDKEKLNDLLEDIAVFNPKTYNEKDVFTEALVPLLAKQIAIFDTLQDKYIQGLERYPIEALKCLKEISSIYLALRK